MRPPRIRSAVPRAAHGTATPPLYTTMGAAAPMVVVLFAEAPRPGAVVPR